jgi:hypothetical protein
VRAIQRGTVGQPPPIDILLSSGLAAHLCGRSPVSSPPVDIGCLQASNPLDFFSQHATGSSPLSSPPSDIGCHQASNPLDSQVESAAHPSTDCCLPGYKHTMEEVSRLPIDRSLHSGLAAHLCGVQPPTHRHIDVLRVYSTPLRRSAVHVFSERQAIDRVSSGSLFNWQHSR